MDIDRKTVDKIISKMLDNPDKNGIYLTSTAYAELELYIEKVRMEAVGWMLANVCSMLDRGEDPRITIVPEIICKAMTDLSV